MLWIFCLPLHTAGSVTDCPTLLHPRVLVYEQPHHFWVRCFDSLLWSLGFGVSLLKLHTHHLVMSFFFSGTTEKGVLLFTWFSTLSMVLKWKFSLRVLAWGTWGLGTTFKCATHLGLLLFLTEKVVFVFVVVYMNVCNSSSAMCSLWSLQIDIAHKLHLAELLLCTSFYSICFHCKGMVNCLAIWLLWVGKWPTFLIELPVII